jgi:hypothetical protein
MANVHETKAPFYKTTFNAANNMIYETEQSLIGDLWRIILGAVRRRRAPLKAAARLRAAAQKKT